MMLWLLFILTWAWAIDIKLFVHVLEYRADVHIKFNLNGSFKLSMCLYAFTLVCEILALSISALKKGIVLLSDQIM